MLTATIVREKYHIFQNYAIDNELTHKDFSLLHANVGIDKIVIFYDKKQYADWCLFCFVMEKELKCRISSNDAGGVK